ncbi:hypothetical protein K5D34_22610 [Pseudomonas cichorii]|nr:hypothetical protein [Pseudomonas cichorii]MBX8512483.1 hypothetical protein [Pseudomonas cichorii]MBX8528034.1 hypothetical protein [Pseudomonas cichorii]MBX8568046.1 hypothetical protein [Pseudomonas cichorii]MBX8592956.1 hypothetical protein [Pseudomonas cichorii]MBX8605378.1 hypothetical protein [Pseudomonas cichorii]
MDEVVAKYRAAGNDWRVPNNELNLGSNLEGEGIYLVRIKSGDPQFSYEMPNGKENGAYPKQWVPGGATKSGTSEAALVGSKKIIHDQDIDTLMKHFEDWEKPQ